MNECKGSVSIAAVGQDLVEHSRSSDLNRKRGLVVELFPFIFGAHERMSGRAVSKFLKEKHGVNLSAVTVTKALNDPKTYWNRFFDTIEPAALIFEREDKKPMKDFLFKEQIFWKPFENAILRAAAKAITPEEVRWAAGILRGKWYTIDLETRLKALPYLAERVLRKVK
jgi:hypothetical protein